MNRFWHVVWYEFWRLEKTCPNTTMEDAPVPPPRPILRYEHGEEAHMWSNLDIRRRPLVHFIVVAIRLWVFNFSLQFDYLYFHHSLVNVTERRINFAEAGPLQFLPVDWSVGDVEPANSSVSIWSKWVLSVSQLQVLGSPATESTSNDRWREGGSNYSTCQPTTFVQMRVPFAVGEPAN
jgi:hypothetical protein